MDWKVLLRLVGEVSVANVSTTLPGDVFWRFEATLERFSCRRASRATAMLPCLGCEKMRAIPVPFENCKLCLLSR